MLKFLTVIGARPQIIKSAAISRVIRNKYPSVIKEVIVHTGQHYDEQMSAVFFEELQIPLPEYNLQIGSGKHGQQTAGMIEGIERVLEKENPDFVIIYGDTNSTLAAAIAVSKTHIPLVHIEAGLRSFNKKMPEEINRILSDHASTFLFPPTAAGCENLVREGFKINTPPPFTMDNPGVFNVGDVMYDNTLFFSQIAEQKSTITAKYNLSKGNFLLATLHRNANTDDSTRLNTLFRTFQAITKQYTIDLVLPLHPRTAKQIDLLLAPELWDEIRSNPHILLMDPVSFLEMIQLEKHAKLILTDSGGVQKEAYFLQKPCLILRPETEWVEIVENGAAILCDADEQRLLNACQYFEEAPAITFKNVYGQGDAAERIVEILLHSMV